jgi:hypothetical protein
MGEGLSTRSYFHILGKAYSSSIGFLLEMYEKFLISRDASPVDGPLLPISWFFRRLDDARVE